MVQILLNSLCACWCFHSSSSINAEEHRTIWAYYLGCGEGWGVITVACEKHAFLPSPVLFLLHIMYWVPFNRPQKSENHQINCGHGSAFAQGHHSLKDTCNGREKGPLCDWVPLPHCTVWKSFLQKLGKVIENTLDEIWSMWQFLLSLLE